MNKENITNLRLWLKEDLPYREKHNLECALAVIDELEREYQELKEKYQELKEKGLIEGIHFSVSVDYIEE